MINLKIFNNKVLVKFNRFTKKHFCYFFPQIIISTQMSKYLENLHE